MAIQDIPVINIQPLTAGGTGDAATQQRIAQDLRRKASHNGFIGITGHGIPADRLATAFAISKGLFDLPMSEKEKAPRPEKGGARRGYAAIGRENAASKAAHVETDPVKRDELFRTVDHKETFDFASENYPDQKNIWFPEEVYPGFRSFQTDFLQEVYGLATTVLELLIASLDLTPGEADNIRALHTGNCDLMRLAHYPPQPADATNNKDDLFSRIGPHTDFSMFTFVFQDGCGGLEFEDKVTGRWITATPADGLIYMNVGDTFELLSNGIYAAAPHRVVGHSSSTNDATSHSSTASPNASRYSIIYFASTAYDSLLQPMPSLITEERKKVCDPIKYGELSGRFHKEIYVN